VYNDSPYSFWEVGLPIILRDRSSKIIGANYVVINQLMAKEKRDINIGWLNPIESPVGQVEVMPEINLLNDDVIIKISAPPGSPPGKE